MSLQQRIGFAQPKRNAAQRLVQRVGATRLGTAGLAKILAPLDRAIHRLTGGRTTAAKSLGGFPIILLETIGARSGAQRTTPLTAVPHQGDLAVVGTNYGTGKAPAWAYNLRANPRVSLTYEDRTVAVAAREASEAEVDEIFAAAIEIYPGYDAYRGRATNPIPVFVLEPAD